MGTVRMSDLPGGRPAEQALRPERQHDGHDRVDHEQLDLGQEMDGAGAGKSDHERADGGAGHAAQPADDAHGEREHDHVDADARHHRDRRRGDRTPERAEHRADHEGRGEHARNVDTHGRRDLAVVDHGAQELSGPRPLQRPPRRDADHDREREQAEIVDGKGDAADRYAAEQLIGLIGEIGIDAPDELDQILEHEERGIGDEHQHDLVAPVHRPEQTALDQQPHAAAHCDAGKDEQQEAAGCWIVSREIGAHSGGGRVGAERVEAAVRNVENFHDAVGERQSHRHDEQPGEVHRAVDEDRVELLHGLSRARARGRPGRWFIIMLLSTSRL